MLNVLLIDDDLLEKDIIDSVFQDHLSEKSFILRHAFKCSEAITLLLKYKFDLVLLDNMLASSISGKFSVPIIRQYLKQSPLVIVSNNIDIDYLKNPQILGVSDIIAKASLNSYLKDFISPSDRANTDSSSAVKNIAKIEKRPVFYTPKLTKKSNLAI